MTYGHEWLKPPLLQDGDPNERILTADLDGIKHFMCPLSGGDTKRCKTCPGFKTCPAGQRALALLDQQARDREKWERVQVVQVPGEAKTKNKISMATVADPAKAANDMQMFRDACESGNPWGYLMERGLSEGAAKEKLIFWIKRYPAIALEHGGKKQILRQVRQTKAVQPEPDVEPETAAVQEPIWETEQLQEPEPVEQPKGRKTSPGAAMQKKTVAAIQEAIASGDPLQWLMDTRGNSPALARQTLKRWKASHPEMFTETEKAEAPEPVEEEVKEPEEKPKQEQVKPEEPKPEEADEISLADFLAEYGVPIFKSEEQKPEEPPKEPEPEPEEPNPETPEMHTAVELARELRDERWINEDGEKVPNPNWILAGLMNEEAALLLRIAKLQEEVWEIRELRGDVEKKMSH